MTNTKHNLTSCLLRLVVAGGGVLLFSSQAAFASEASGVTNAAAPGGLLEAALFYFVALVAVVSSLGVCFSKDIVRMAVWLFGALGSVAVMYFLLAANFLGAIQLIVYAGGTLILLVFGVMLTSKSPWVKFECPKIEMLFAGIICAALLGCLCIVLTDATWAGTMQVVPGASVEAIGKILITKYLVPFEVAGVLLMIVMVGAAHLARQDD